MKVAVRLDDITPDMDWERFFKFKTLLDKYQVKPLIGVIPDNQDECLKACGCEKGIDFWERIRELVADGWVVAMHGYRHLYTTSAGGMFPLNNFSEFAGLPYEEQKDMLAEGKQILSQRGIETDLFMAPAHSYDRNTLKALKETGFKAVTDGFGDMPYRYEGINFYPISFRLSKTFKKKSGYSTMVVHTGTITDEDLIKYENYLKNQNVCWISYQEYLKQPTIKRGNLGRVKEFLMAKLKYMLTKLQ